MGLTAHFLIHFYAYTSGKGGKGNKMADFKIIESQEELDKILKDRLDRAKAQSDKAEESLKDEIKKLKAELEESKAQATEAAEKVQAHDGIVAKLNEEIAGYRLSTLKHQIAHEYNLPYEMAERLKGVDEDELKADAESLKKYVGVGKQPVLPLATAEVPPATPEDSFRRGLKDLSKELRKE